MSQEPPLQRLPPQWETARLLVRDAAASDTDTLHALFNANADIERWDPTFAPVPRAEVAGVVAHALAGRNPDGDPYQLQVFERKPAALCRLGEQALPGHNNIVGYFHCTYGRPQPDVIWISMWVMHPSVRRTGLAREALQGAQYLWRLLAGPYTRAWARVWLKNWPALRFWAGSGFDTIVRWDGDRELSDTTTASVVLEWKWREPRAALLARVDALAGKYDKGPNDLTENPDEYLAETVEEDGFP